MILSGHTSLLMSAPHWRVFNKKVFLSKSLTTDTYPWYAVSQETKKKNKNFLIGFLLRFFKVQRTIVRNQFVNCQRFSDWICFSIFRQWYWASRLGWMTSSGDLVTVNVLSDESLEFTACIVVIQKNTIKPHWMLSSCQGVDGWFPAQLHSVFSGRLCASWHLIRYSY